MKKSMSFETLSKIWNKQQKITAKQAIRKADRAKQSFTDKELLNKYAQLGHRLTYKKQIYFTFVQEMGMGLLITEKGMVLGATISDFFNEIEKIKKAI